MKTIFFVITVLFANLAIATPAANFYFGLGTNIGGQYKLSEGKTQSPVAYKIIFGETTKGGVTGELHYYNMGFGGSTLENKKDKSLLQLKSIGYAILFYFDAGKRVFPFIKLGYHSWSSEVYGIQSTGNLGSISDNGANSFYGFGLDVALSNNWFVRLGYDAMNFKPVNNAINKSTTSVGMSSIMLTIINRF